MNTVKDVLAAKGSDCTSVGPEASVFEALQKMAERNIGALVVVDDAGNLVGIFSERDYARKIILKDRSSKETKVREVMTKNVATIPLSMKIEECMALMTGKRVRHLPVIDNDRLVGILSIGDVVKATIAEKEFLIDQLEHYIIGDR